MNLTDITKLEEIHTPIEAHFFTPDGLGDTWVQVCAFCDGTNNHYAALWPCETMQEAYDTYDHQ